MEFLSRFDLNFVCRVFEWCAVIALVCGVFLSLYLGIDTNHYHTRYDFGIIIGGILISFL